MRTHPTFYVGRLRPYYQYEPVSRCEEHLRGREPRPPSSVPFQQASLVDYRSDLLTQLSDVSTRYSQLVTKRTNRTFVLKLRKRKHDTIVRTIVR
uniref:Uncharacterized protein n=1 Tax=Peronospora matthiolae TaxID=2874970 RepID=A0AAV1TPM3_9STRA